MGILDDAIREHLELKRKHGVPEDEVQRQEEEALGPARREVAQQPEDAELAAGQTATAEAETPLFDMEQGNGEPSSSAAPEPDAVTEAAEAAGPDQPPAGMEPQEPAAEPAAEEPPSLEHAEPTVVQPPPVEPAPVEPPPVEPAPVEPPPVEPAPVEPPPVEPAAVEPPPTELVAEAPPAEPMPQEPPPVAPTPEEPTPEEEPVSDDELGDTEPHGFPALDDDEHEGVEDEDVLAEDEDLDVLEDTPDFLQETPEHDRLWFEQKPPRDFDFD